MDLEYNSLKLGRGISMRDAEDCRIVAVRVTAAMVIVSLADGREISTPLSWYPSLAGANSEQRNHFEITPFGVHWPDLDEDLSIAGMLAGQSSRRQAPSH